MRGKCTRLTRETWRICLACGLVSSPSLRRTLSRGDDSNATTAVFSRCADSMEEGRRLENLSWRIWNRETFCCESQPQFTTTPAIDISPRPDTKDIPELSTSVDSIASEEAERMGSPNRSQALPLDIKRPSWGAESVESHISSRGSQKHITSAGLEKMVISIKEKKQLEPLSPSIAEAVPMYFPSTVTTTSPEDRLAIEHASDSSSSTSSTAPMSSPDSASNAVGTVGSDTSAELHTSHSVVRGFSPGHISSSYRSHVHLAPTPVAAKPIPQTRMDDPKKNSGLFLLGGSSGEEDSSFEEQMSSVPPQSSLATALKSPVDEKKQTSFKDEVESRIIAQRQSEDEDVFESDDEEEEEEDVSESAIEDEDDSDWEDSASESGAMSPSDKNLFQRVDSRPNLTSRRSLLTTLIHQPDRAAALAQMATKSTPALHRSRTSSPNGPSLASSLEEESTMADHPRSKPIIMTTSNTHPPALSPKTTRRNMLATELTESLRKHLLWERQQKNTTANAVLKRRHTAHEMANLHKYPGSSPSSGTASKNNSWNHYFDHGLGEYHQKGW